MTKQMEQRLIEFIRDCQFSLDPYVEDQSKKLMNEYLTKGARDGEYRANGLDDGTGSV